MLDVYADMVGKNKNGAREVRVAGHSTGKTFGDDEEIHWCRNAATTTNILLAFKIPATRAHQSTDCRSIQNRRSRFRINLDRSLATRISYIIKLFKQTDHLFHNFLHID